MQNALSDYWGINMDLAVVGEWVGKGTALTALGIVGTVLVRRAIQAGKDAESAPTPPKGKETPHAQKQIIDPK